MALADAPDNPQAVVTGTVDAVLRLIEGRLPADLADDALTVSGGDVHVALLRQAFPGF